MQLHIISWNISFCLSLAHNFRGLKMKAFVILSVLVAGALCARLDNTYIPPASAHSAGGYNLDTPKQALASNVQNSFAQPGGGRVQNSFQQQSHSQPGLNQGTFTSVSRGNGFQSVSVGAHSGQQSGFQQQSYQAPQQNYQQQSQASYQPQQQQYNNYQQNQQSSYNNGPSTTPIPILKCKKKSDPKCWKCWKNALIVAQEKRTKKLYTGCDSSLKV